MNYKIVHGNEFQDLSDINYKLARVVWADFMLHDAVAGKYFNELYNLFAKYQFALLDKVNGEVMALGNSIPFRWDDEIKRLPDEGWDWVLQKGVHDYREGLKPNTLSAIQIMIPPKYNGQGISYEAVKVMIGLASDSGFKNMVAPVRPNQKSIYPLIPMEKYILWDNGDDLPFDAWLRVHVRLGGKIIKVCPRAMLIEGSVGEWEEWTKMKFLESGSYVVPGALVPVEIDTESDRGRYVEPNVWINHLIK